MQLAKLTRRFIDFQGTGSGNYDLTWSQKQICIWMEQSAPHFENMNLSVLVQIESGTGVDDVETALKLLIERHEALRTRIYLDLSGGYRQSVHRNGKLPVDIFECTTDDEANSILAEMREVPFTEMEWPIRVAILVSAGKVGRVALCVSHMATDGWGIEVLRRELKELASTDYSRKEYALRRPVTQPRQQSAIERANGNSTVRRVEDFWVTHLKHFPNERFPFPQRVPESPRFPEIMMESRTAAKAIAKISERDQVTAHTIVMGAISILLTALSHTDRATFRLFCANRLNKASRYSLGNFSQVVPLSVQVGDLPFRDVVRNAWQESMCAYRIGAVDPDRLSALEKSLMHELGMAPDLECFINLHVSHEIPTGAAARVTPEALDITRIWKRGGQEIWEPRKFFIDVWVVSERLLISLWGDTEIFPSNTLSNFLSFLENILLRAAVDSELNIDGALQEFGQLVDIPIQSGLERFDECWVDLAEVRHSLVDCLRPNDIKVVLDREEGTAGRKIKAYLELGDRDLSIRDVHRLMLDRIGNHRFVVTPHTYVLCEGAPGVSNSTDAWACRPVVAEGSGRF